MGGHRHVQDERLPRAAGGRSGPSRSAIRSSAASRTGMTDFLFPLSTAKYTSNPVEKINFRVSIESQEEIKNLYSPTHPRRNPAAGRSPRLGDFHGQGPGARVRFPPALRYRPRQGEHAGAELSPDGSQDGYFLLLASPQIKAGGERPKKTVLLVMDRSGSMSGQKIEQVRAAAEARPEQPPRGRPVQYNRLRQRGRVVPPGVAAIQRQDPPRGPGVCRGALCRRQHEHQRGPADFAGPAQ